MEEIHPGDMAQLRKKHPCGQDQWQVVRAGTDVRLRCLGCGRYVLMERREFLRRLKRFVHRDPPSKEAGPGAG